MEPRLACGGWIPIPRKLMLASARTALLNPIVIAGIRTGSVFGRICEYRILGVDTPISRADLM